MMDIIKVGLINKLICQQQHLHQKEQIMIDRLCLSAQSGFTALLNDRDCGVELMTKIRDERGKLWYLNNAFICVLGKWFFGKNECSNVFFFNALCLIIDLGINAQN